MTILRLLIQIGDWGGIIKNRLIIAILAVIGIGGFIFYTVNDNNVVHQSKSIALAVMFESINDITNSSSLVVKGNIPKGFTEFERQLTDKVVTEHNYKINVTEVVSNNSGEEINIGDELTISRAVSFKQGSSIYGLLDGGSEELETGNYLLFLNLNPEDATQFNIVSPNHIYKEGKEEEYLNIIKGTKINRIGKKEVSIITDKN